MAIKRYQSDLPRESGVVGMAGQETARFNLTLADKLRNFQSREQDALDRQAAVEGERAGMQAGTGKKGGVDLEDEETIRGRAFNKGVLTANLAEIQTDVRDSIAMFETEADTNLDLYDSRVKGYRDGLVAEVNPQLRPLVEQEITDMAGRSRVRIHGRFQEKVRGENLAAITSNLDALEQEALNAAHSGDFEHAMVKGDQMIVMLENAVDAGLIDAAKAEGMKLRLNDDISTRLVTGEFERTVLNDGVEAGEKSLKAFMQEKHEDLDQGTRDDIINRMNSILSRARANESRERSRANAELAAAEKALAGRVKDAKDSVSKGFLPPDLDDTVQASYGTKYEQDMRELKNTVTATEEFVKLSPGEQTAMIKNLRGDRERSGAEARIIDHLESVHEYTMREINDGRGLELALRQGIIDDLPPIDPEDPASVQTRNNTISMLESHYGQPVSPLTQTETDLFVNSLDAMDADQKTVALGDFVGAFGERSLPALEDMAGKDAGAYAVAGAAMVEGYPDTGKNILVGLDTIKANPKIISSDFPAAFADRVSDTYVGRQEQQRVIMQSVQALYAQKLARNGSLVTESVSEDLLDSAIDEVTNGIIEIDAEKSGIMFDSSYSIEAPSRGVDADAFEDWIDGITEADISAMGSSTLPDKQTAEIIRSGAYRLVSLGKGHYQVVLNNGLTLMKNERDPFELVWGD